MLDIYLPTMDTDFILITCTLETNNEIVVLENNAEQNTRTFEWRVLYIPSYTH